MNWKLYLWAMLVSQLSFSGGLAYARKMGWLLISLGLVTGGIMAWEFLLA